MVRLPIGNPLDVSNRILLTTERTFAMPSKGIRKPVPSLISRGHVATRPVIQMQGQVFGYPHLCTLGPN
ncbi:MAG: hypothetical protein Gyms2KO_44700 [Gymnodinialimonas sp.]